MTKELFNAFAQRPHATPIAPGVPLSRQCGAQRPSEDHSPSTNARTNIKSAESIPLPPPKLLVIGASAIDITARVSDSYAAKQVAHTTAPGNVTLTVGGVARNIAEAAHRVL